MAQTSSSLQKNWYAGVKREDLPEIVESLAGGSAVTRLDTMDASLKELIFLPSTAVFSNLRCGYRREPQA